MIYTYEFNINNRMPTQRYNFNISQYKNNKKTPNYKSENPHKYKIAVIKT